MARPLLLGHRGARKYAPENTADAFVYALEDGCDGFELDVRLTSDRQPVVCHDPIFCRATVAKATYQRLFEIGSKKRKEISTLEEILAFGSRAFLNIELKVAGAEEILLDLLKQYPAKRGLVVSSFLPKVVSRLVELGAEFPLGIICDNPLQLARGIRLPSDAVMVNRSLVNRRLVDQLKAADKQIFVWTVNSARDMKRFAEMGVDGIISDDTKLLAKTLGGPQIRMSAATQSATPQSR